MKGKYYSKTALRSYTYYTMIVFLLCLCFPSNTSSFKIPFFGEIFGDQENSATKIKETKFDKPSSIRPIINQDGAEFGSSFIVQQDKEVTFPTGNSSLLIIVPAILGGLLILSVLFYALDVYATSRIDQFLYETYGPEVYDRYTSVYDPTDYYSLYNTNGYYSATTASQYYGARRRSDEVKKYKL